MGLLWTFIPENSLIRSNPMGRYQEKHIMCSHSRISSAGLQNILVKSTYHMTVPEVKYSEQKVDI